MAAHLYNVGELVSLDFDRRIFLSKATPFTVEAQLPHVGTRLQYRIKNGCEAFRRVVSEHQISRFSAPPTLASDSPDGGVEALGATGRS